MIRLAEGMEMRNEHILIRNFKGI